MKSRSGWSLEYLKVHLRVANTLSRWLLFCSVFMFWCLRYRRIWLGFFQNGRMSLGNSWAHLLFHFWEEVSPFYLPPLKVSVKTWLRQMVSKLSSLPFNLQEKPLVPLHFFLVFLISIAKHWSTEPQEWLSWGSASGTALGPPFYLHPMPVRWGDFCSRKHFSAHQGWLTTEADRNRFVSIPFVKTNQLLD